MLPQVRIVLITSLSLAIWLIADGVRCLVAGSYFSRTLDSVTANTLDTAVVLGDGRVVDYGRWGAFLLERGIDPHALAPVFIVVGALGLVGLFLFLQARPVGWALLLAFALGASLRFGAQTAVAGALAVTLLLPWTFRLVTGPDRTRSLRPPPS